MFKNSSVEFHCSDYLVIMCSIVHPAGPYAVYTDTVSETVAVSIFRDVTPPGRPKCRQQVTCSHNPEDPNLHHHGRNVTKFHVSHFRFKRLQWVSRALD